MRASIAEAGPVKFSPDESEVEPSNTFVCSVYSVPANIGVMCAYMVHLFELKLNPVCVLLHFNRFYCEPTHLFRKPRENIDHKYMYCQYCNNICGIFSHSLCNCAIAFLKPYTSGFKIFNNALAKKMQINKAIHKFVWH